MGLEVGEQFELRVTPDRYTTVRYAGASGDFNPIHIDEQFALSVGLPGRILHGLWSMAQVARAATDAAGGDPLALTELSVQFRGMGRLEQEIVVSGEVQAVSDARARVKLEARQGDTRLVRNAQAELLLR
ncbi:MaoC/PaaZ C-terminal domain-containing protein [Conexibacter sp. S30A1]|jgi:acyl dehydratase|uniref:MaoC/PaaZ C-terminal domain-containing protein n=1 Tax=Conexibacter sp. S30A1 TaxID=2937800 RepID=UPI00200EB231|nr:MaoC/PaaZ C-terminal domain-containing protein [Conexibacter sp. S30A1]